MKILVINPNTSDRMTEHIRAELERIKCSDTELRVENPSEGPPFISFAYDVAVAAPQVIQMVGRANEAGYDAIVVACFSDPAVSAGKEISHIPVLGIAEVSFHIAALLGHRFCVVATLRTRVPSIELQVRQLGMEKMLASVRALNMNALEVDAKPDESKAAILELGRQAIAEDGAEVLVLGCAGLTGYETDLTRQLGIPVVDPTSATFKVAEAMADLGLTHSKVGLFSQPLGPGRGERL